MLLVFLAIAWLKPPRFDQALDRDQCRGPPVEELALSKADQGVRLPKDPPGPRAPCG